MPLVWPIQQSLMAGAAESERRWLMHVSSLESAAMESALSRLETMDKMTADKLAEQEQKLADQFTAAINELTDAIDSIGEIAKASQKLSEELQKELLKLIPPGSRVEEVPSRLHPMPSAGGLDAIRERRTQDSYTGEVRLVVSSLPAMYQAGFIDRLPDYPGWLWCTGQYADKSKYAGLYAVIGPSYGESDDGKAFRIPRKQDLTSDTRIIDSNLLWFIIRR